jgi:hypothetical protein
VLLSGINLKITQVETVITKEEEPRFTATLLPYRYSVYNYKQIWLTDTHDRVTCSNYNLGPNKS